MGNAAGKQETQIVGRYAIDGEIATGGMASVHYGSSSARSSVSRVSSERGLGVAPAGC